MQVFARRARRRRRETQKAVLRLGASLVCPHEACHARHRVSLFSPSVPFCACVPTGRSPLVHCSRLRRRTWPRTRTPASAHTHAPTHPHTHTHTLTHPHPHARTPAHPHTHTPDHPHARSPALAPPLYTTPLRVRRPRANASSVTRAITRTTQCPV